VKTLKLWRAMKILTFRSVLSHTSFTYQNTTFPWMGNSGFRKKTGSCWLHFFRFFSEKAQILKLWRVMKPSTDRAEILHTSKYTLTTAFPHMGNIIFKKRFFSLHPNIHGSKFFSNWIFPWIYNLYYSYATVPMKDVAIKCTQEIWMNEIWVITSGFWP